LRSRSARALVCVAFLAAPSRAAHAADQSSRKPLGIEERNAVLTLIKAVDVAQETDVTATERVSWSGHVLRSGNQTGYLPFRLTLGQASGVKSLVVYVRAVTRHDGIQARDEHSVARDWLLRGQSAPPRTETVYVGQGEMPIGGPAASSSRTAVSGPAQALAVLALQQREMEKQKAAADAAKKKKGEAPERNPFLFPFEDYYVADVASGRRDGAVLERALSLPPGEYDVYIGVLDRQRIKTSGPVVVKRTITVPNFWNDEIALSSLILASEVRMLNAAPSAKQQLEHPYMFGRAEVVPVAAAAFSAKDAISVVYQVCNYGAPDADLEAAYNFYRLDGGSRVLFNRTPPQRYGDDDLPAPGPWETVAFAMQTVSLETFPPGEYELEVTVRDRLTRRTATGSVPFTVAKP
jgi:hypothetical protein